MAVLFYMYFAYGRHSYIEKKKIPAWDFTNPKHNCAYRFFLDTNSSNPKTMANNNTNAIVDNQHGYQRNLNSTPCPIFLQI